MLNTQGNLNGETYSGDHLVITYGGDFIISLHFHVAKPAKQFCKACVVFLHVKSCMHEDYHAAKYRAWQDNMGSYHSKWPCQIQKNNNLLKCEGQNGCCPMAITQGQKQTWFHLLNSVRTQLAIWNQENIKSQGKSTKYLKISLQINIYLVKVSWGLLSSDGGS